MGAAVALLLIGAGRAAWRARRKRRHQPVRNAERCLVYGVDEAGERLVRVLWAIRAAATSRSVCSTTTPDTGACAWPGSACSVAGSSSLRPSAGPERAR
ncbi:hypothetical protein [Micromonospora coerulea]|uniref:hypothetical protein n=1 Tax=Micromonospora coerulea TaxID=47856 RepID=UPI001F29EFFA|nr:hypothetical protein [Micromonospora veneta]